MASFSLQQHVKALLIDWPVFEWRLHVAPLTICNRREMLQLAPGGNGVCCCWQWTSDLRLCKMYPLLGRRLLERMLALWPVTLTTDVPAMCDPQVSFIIGHRGKSRLPHLLATLASIAAQSGVMLEVIVVDQAEGREVRSALPAWIRYCHTPPPDSQMPYCRSWAFNVGARLARGRLLIFHDNDLVIPREYAQQAWLRFQEGYDVINLKRFIFYLTEKATHDFMVSSRTPHIPAEAPLSIMQNAEGGGSLAVSRQTYNELGGFDESFIGWGGEDNEFWDRCRTRTVWNFGNIPLIHLWHPPQPEKVMAGAERTNQKLLDLKLVTPVKDRIHELASRDYGNPERLSL